MVRRTKQAAEEQHALCEFAASAEWCGEHRWSPDLEADRAIQQPVCGGPAITEFIGDTPARFPERYREGSASGLLPIGTRQEIFVAGTFGEAWMTLFKQYVAAADKAGDPVRLLKMDSAGHFDGINPQAPAWQGVIASIQSLVGVH